jgi:hypothetical protein
MMQIDWCVKMQNGERQKTEGRSSGVQEFGNLGER